MNIFDAAFLASTVIIAAPLLVAAAGELVAQRAGVMNVGLEGVMLAGAFFAYLATVLTGSILLGFLGGMLGGLVFGALLAVLSINARADQIVAGIALNILGFGVTSFLNQALFQNGQGPVLVPLPDLAIPFLADLPLIGRALFAQDAFVYFAFVLLGFVGWMLYRTTWGVSLRAVGESPTASEAAGVGVRAMRWSATLFGAACAGLAGAYLSVGDLGVFRDGMSGGRGFLALAAVMFGAWRLWGASVACLLFAAADALQLRLQGGAPVPATVWIAAAVIVLALAIAYLVRHRRTLTVLPLALRGAAVVVLAILAVWAPPVAPPAPIWLILPYLLALTALATGDKRRGTAPAALTVPYCRGDA